jgi:hypothetical protein
MGVKIQSENVIVLIFRDKSSGAYSDDFRTDL